MASLIWDMATKNEGFEMGRHVRSKWGHVYRERASAIRTMEVIEALVQTRLRGRNNPEDGEREIALLRTLWRENNEANESTK